MMGSPRRVALCRLCYGPEHNGPHEPVDCEQHILRKLRDAERHAQLWRDRLARVRSIV